MSGSDVIGSRIELSDVGKQFQTRSGVVQALRNISFSVEPGEFVSLLGPSGCGKSTLLRLIAGLQPASSGRVVVNEKMVTGPIRGVGMAFQKAVLLNWSTVLNNVLLPARMLGLKTSKYETRARELLELVGLTGFADKYPRELSGGMQQRVSLCRALLLDPPLLLMDEPFGALDAMTRDEMILELARIVESGRAAGDPKTIVFVTHSVPEAVLLSDRIVVLSARPGRISQVVDVDLPRPRQLETRVSETFTEITGALFESLHAQFAAVGRD